jgi:putative hydrolase
MLANDLHVHSIRSQCGTMTYGEIVGRARALGMRSVAITDHALAFHGNRWQFHILVKRFPDVVEGVRVYKGIELNVVDEDGTVDMPDELLGSFDYVSVGLHSVEGCFRSDDAATNTAALMAALEHNPWIDAVVHPTHRTHPLQFSQLLPAMARLEVAFEVNECGHRYGKSDPSRTAEVLGRAVLAGVPLLSNSDAHVFHEVGADEAILDVFRRADLDPEIAVNTDADALEAFLETGRGQRRAAAEERS